MQFSALLASLLTTVVCVTASPITPRQDGTATDFDQPACFFKSQGVFVSWAVIIPAYLDKKPDQMKGDFFGSVTQNSACRGLSSKQWHAVGPDGRDLAVTFSSSDFCTALQMTNIIKDTTGGIQSTACEAFTGETGPEVILPPGPKKRDENEPEEPNQAELAQKLGLSIDASREEIKQRLSETALKI